MLLPHGPTILNGVGIGDRHGIDGGDRIWLGSPLFYGLGAANALPVAITHGATLVLQDKFDPALAINRIERHQCNVGSNTPIHLEKHQSITPYSGNSRWRKSKVQGPFPGRPLGQPNVVKVGVGELSVSTLTQR